MPVQVAGLTGVTAIAGESTTVWPQNTRHGLGMGLQIAMANWATVLQPPLHAGSSDRSDRRDRHRRRRLPQSGPQERRHGLGVGRQWPRRLGDGTDTDRSTPFKWQVYWRDPHRRRSQYSLALTATARSGRGGELLRQLATGRRLRAARQFTCSLTGVTAIAEILPQSGPHQRRTVWAWG